MSVAGFPIEWHPAKLSNFGRLRGGQVPVAEVDHRMVGWLQGTRRYFTATSERPVSTHFGIGHDGVGALCPECGSITGARGRLVIDQYVDLADTAYGNGNWHSSGGWPLVKRTSSGAVINPNLYTYSIEHEDGATAGRGIVTAHIIRASIELTALLHGGNLSAIRGAGIRIGSQPYHPSTAGATIAAALRAIPPQPERFVSHHRISGILKPYCWEPWLSDRGFVRGGTQSRLLARLEGDAPPSGASARVTVPRGTYHRGRVSGGRFLGYLSPDLTTGGFSAWAGPPTTLDNAGVKTTWFRILSGAYAGTWLYRYDDRLTWRPV